MYQNLLQGFQIGNIDNFAVNGAEGVNAFNTQPNQRYALFDNTDDIIYFISTDVNNVKSKARRVRFVDEPEPEPETPFVTKKEFEELKGEIGNVQQSIRELIAIQSISKPENNERSTGASNAPEYRKQRSDRANKESSD